MRIATDIDGVLAEFAGGWVDRYNADFGAGLRLADLASWDAVVTATSFPDTGAFFDWLDGVDGFWADLVPVTGAAEAVGRLRRGGHELVAVTQRPDTSGPQTEEWLAEHFGGMELHLVDDKTVVRCDLAIDDSPDVLRQLVRAGTPAVRYARPWNADAPGIPANSWQDVVDLVERRRYLLAG